MWSRRQFIKTLGVLGGAVAAPFHWLGRAQAAAVPQADLPPGAELYGGFLLLPEGAPVPAMVKPTKIGPPQQSNQGGKDGTSSAVVTVSVGTIADLIKQCFAQAGAQIAPAALPPHPSLPPTRR